MQRPIAVLVILVALSSQVSAGPPYVTDDPEPTEYKRHEVYLFTGGTRAKDGTGGVAGIDFNYGAAPDLQLTVVVPLGFDRPAGGVAASGLGRVELAAKYRVFHQQDIGWDVVVFPRVFLPAGAAALGERHASLLLPLWFGRDWSRWSTFGGGGCVLNRGAGSKDFCLMGWALTRQLSDKLSIGAELTHATADSLGGRESSGLGVGFVSDLSTRLHLLGSLGSGIQNAADTNRYSWYLALLFTY